MIELQVYVEGGTICVPVHEDEVLRLTEFFGITVALQMLISTVIKFEL